MAVKDGKQAVVGQRIQLCDGSVRVLARRDGAMGEKGGGEGVEDAAQDKEATHRGRV